MKVHVATITTRVTHFAATLDEADVHAALVEYVLARSGKTITHNLKRDVNIAIDDRTGEAEVHVNVSEEVPAA